jgi:hypothetical protein
VPMRAGFGSDTRDTAMRWNPVTGQSWIYLEVVVAGVQQFAWLPVWETPGHVPHAANTAPVLSPSKSAKQNP